MDKIKRYLFKVKKRENFVKILKLFINCPYKWGGTTYKKLIVVALVQIYYKYNNKFFPGYS